MIERYEDMPVGVFEKVTALLQGPGDAAAMTAGLIALLSGTTAEEVERLPIREYIRRREALAFLNSEPDVRRGRMPRAYDIAGQRVKVQAEPMRLTAAQFIDAQEYLRDGGVAAHLADIICCFLIPEGRQYNDGYDMDALKAAVRDHLPVTEALRLSAFFLRRWDGWWRRTLGCCAAAAWLKDRKGTKDLRRKITATMRAGAGWPL